MADVMSLIKEIMTVTSAIGELKGSIANLQRKNEDHSERIIRLESREELIMEKTKNAAITAVYQLGNQYTDRLSAVERRFDAIPSHSNSNAKDTK